MNRLERYIKKKMEAHKARSHRAASDVSRSSHKLADTNDRPLPGTIWKKRLDAYHYVQITQIVACKHGPHTHIHFTDFTMQPQEMEAVKFYHTFTPADEVESEERTADTDTP